MILSGTVIHNLGVASRTIAKQKPFFKAQIPNIDDYRNGTINLLTASELGQIIKYDTYFKKLQWDDNNTHLREDFGFIKIRKLVHNNEVFLNWGYLYFPMESPNRMNKRLVELLGKNDPDVKVGDFIHVYIGNGYISDKPEARTR